MGKGSGGGETIKNDKKSKWNKSTWKKSLLLSLAIRQNINLKLNSYFFFAEILTKIIKQNKNYNLQLSMYMIRSPK